jgi:hypothetical protein
VDEFDNSTLSTVGALLACRQKPYRVGIPDTGCSACCQPAQLRMCFMIELPREDAIAPNYQGWIAAGELQLWLLCAAS